MSRSPDFYLGDSEAPVPNWGGRVRSCYVLARPLLATGRPAWRVRVDPPMPGIPGGQLDEVIVTERAATDDLTSPRHGWVQVNICAQALGVDRSKEQFGPRELRILYWGEAALDPAQLPVPPNYKAEWERTLRRIKRFIDQYGHSRVPEPYHDDDGRLDIIVENLRWHHAGRGGIDPGPFPGVDYAADLDRLAAWDWDVELTEGES